MDRVLLEDAINLQEVPRIEQENGTTYIFTKFVYKDIKDQIQTAPMLIIIIEKNVITVSAMPFPRLPQFTKGLIPFVTYNKTQLLVALFDQINDTYNDHINSISKKVRGLSVNIDKIRNRDIIQFVHYENILYDLNSTLVRINAIFTKLYNGKNIKFSVKEKEMIQDLNLDNDQFIQITKENMRSISTIREAYSTIMTNNLNGVIKLFTSLTVVLTVPTIVGTFYGMNVGLPFQDNPHAFFIIVGSTALVSAITIAIFFHKDWL